MVGASSTKSFRATRRLSKRSRRTRAGGDIAHSIKLDVFGRRMVALRTENAWSVFYLGSDGKRRPAIDVFVPSWVKESDLVEYLVDLCLYCRRCGAVLFTLYVLAQLKR